ncbi:hypothetical protein [Rhizobacter sp. OV335]|uniref:hypothetical protein n=1 Tax=Rhizobacter sp. OV335 TaxID=1500264 RepID=UPI0009221877|nr:hypothetical protein [Rhizobacter sp. OV335]SHM97387.1 hypothetical protein SAMN02787076_02772 [Rhizobacter sp. OV335]
MSTGILSSPRNGTPSSAGTAQDSINEVQPPSVDGTALISKLSGAHGIDISNADKATRAKYKAFTKHHPVLHPACALWFAKQCLVAGDKDLFCEVVNSFMLKRLQGIVEGAGIVARCLKNLPQVHQIEFASGCELTTECIAELCDVLREKRTAPFELNLHGCTLCRDAAMSLARELRGLQGLAMLSISEPKVTDAEEWIPALAAGLARNTELVAFKLGVPDLTKKQAEVMGEGLRGCRSLVELHLSSGDLASLAHLLASLGEKDPLDPDSPGSAARPLTTVSIVGRTGPGQRLFPEGAVKSLSEFVARYPSLKCVHMSPSLHVQSFTEFEEVMTLCGSEWKNIEIDIDFSLVVDNRAETKSGELIERETGKVLHRTSAYLRRKDASHRLLSGTEFRDVTRRLLASALEGKLLPGDVISEIALPLLTDRSPPGGSLMTLNTLSRINKKTAGLGPPAAMLRSAHFERLKGLMTFSAFAFGTSELADSLCFKLSERLRQGRLSKNEKKALTLLVQTGRPDGDALEKTIREAQIHRWRAQQDQAHLLMTCRFDDEFLAEQKSRWKFQKKSRDFLPSLKDQLMQTEAESLRRKKTVENVKKAALEVRNFFKKPPTKND